MFWQCLDMFFGNVLAMFLACFDNGSGTLRCKNRCSAMILALLVARTIGFTMILAVVFAMVLALWVAKAVVFTMLFVLLLAKPLFLQ